MGKYGNEVAVEALGQVIKQDCLLDQKSLLTGKSLWTAENFDELYRRYNLHPDESNGTFDAKVLAQLSGASSAAWQLFAELYVVDLLVLGNVTAATKVAKIEAILQHCTPPLSLSGPEAPAGARAVTETFEGGGALNGGQGYNTTRWKQFRYLIDFGRRWAAMSPEERASRMSTTEQIEETVYHLPEATEPQIKRVMCYLLDPGEHVPISAGAHLEKITSHFDGYLAEEERGYLPEHQAGVILRKLRQERGPEWDFYLDPDEWNPSHTPAPVAEPDPSPFAPTTGPEGELSGGLPPFPAGTAESLLVSEEWLAAFHRVLGNRKQVVFQGPPGTGKTYLARRIAARLAGAKERVALVQFHPAYTYEDFFEGFRPTTAGGLELRPGPLRKLAESAVENPELTYFLIIDEMNRGNLARIFGELYFLLEYRDETVELMYSQEQFTLPGNLFIIATMNTADRSIALVDSAMRRRFAFMTLAPDAEPTSGLLARWCAQEGKDESVVPLWRELNRRIAERDRERMIGPSYFMRDSVYEPGGLGELWQTEILPQLWESFYGEEDRVAGQFGLPSVRAAVEATIQLQPPATL